MKKNVDLLLHLTKGYGCSVKCQSFVPKWWVEIFKVDKKDKFDETDIFQNVHVDRPEMSTEFR